MLKRLARMVMANWWLKLLALGLAYALWLAVAYAPTVDIGFSVPLELENLPANLQVVGEIPARVHLHLRGSESVLRELSPTDLGVVVDLGGASPGTRTVSLHTDDVQVPPGVEVVRISPQEVRLELLPVPPAGASPAPGT